MKQILILLTAVIALTACQSAGRNKNKEENRPIITVTIEPIRYFTEAIAGDHYRVVSMVPRGASPESYDPTPQQLMELSKSTAYLRIGYIGFEQTWMERLSDNVPHLPIFDLSEGIDLITDDSGHGIEPHIWNSATNAAYIAGNILKTLCTLDEPNADFYRQRYDSLCSRIAHTDSVIRRTLAVPDADRAFLIYHPALSYFARDYGLHQISIEHDGKEPSPAQLQSLIDQCQAEEVRIIFVQPEFDRRNAKIIAQQTNTQVVDVNPLSYDWEEEMLKTARALTTNKY